MRARNGADFAALWRGEWEGRYPSQSEADLALCGALAFWTGRDAGRVERLFQLSGLMRPKWERDDYRQRTIDAAIAGCRDTSGAAKSAEPIRDDDELLDAGPSDQCAADPSLTEANPFHVVEPAPEPSDWPAPPAADAMRGLAGDVVRAIEPHSEADPVALPILTPPRLVAMPLTDVAMRSIEWLERPLWQRSAFQLLAGAKGAGKGTYLAALAARISRSGKNVLFISSEDSTEIDLKPRLVAAGADIPRCFTLQQHVRLPEDVPDLAVLARSIGGVALFVIDPVANHIGDSNSNSDAEVRHAIAPLNGLADELGCLLIGVRHPGKDRSRGALASILGSTAWVDTPRAVVMIAVDDEDVATRHVQVLAGNRSLNGSAQAFRIEAVPVDGLAEPITRAVELGESAKSVEDLLGAKPPETRTGQARELILDVLDADGWQESDTLDARIARETGLAVKTVKNARVKLKDEGLIRTWPNKDETGAITRWLVARTGAPRP